MYVCQVWKLDCAKFYYSVAVLLFYFPGVQFEATEVATEESEDAEVSTECVLYVHGPVIFNFNEHFLNVQCTVVWKRSSHLKVSDEHAVTLLYIVLCFSLQRKK